VALRVLFLTQTYPRFPEDTSGPFIRDLGRGLVAGGDEVTVLTPHSKGVEKRWDDGGVEVISFRYAPEPYEVLGYSRSLSSDERIRLGSALVTPLYALAGTAAVRCLLHKRDFDLLHAHWVVPNAFLAAPAVGKLPWAIGLHGSDVFLAERPGIRALVRGVLGRARLLTGCSPELVNRVCALGFERERAEVIPYGVDTDAFMPEGDRGDWRQRLGIPDGAPVVLSVGRMVTKKGYQVLLEALPQLLEDHPTAHLVLGGTGDRLEEFRIRAGSISDRVHLPGIVLRDRLPALYRTADIFVLPAVHDPKGNVDGLPNVILEAMASGLPVVASAISGIPLAIESGVTGLLVPEGDLEGLRRGLSTLLADPGRRAAMGLASRQKATRELTWAAVAERYRKAYEKALRPAAG
jgi:glycosyltransferase involved in cell wall biosynthesis